MNRDYRLFDQGRRDLDFKEMARGAGNTMDKKKMLRYDVHSYGVDHMFTHPYKGMYKGPNWVEGEPFFIRWVNTLFPQVGAANMARLLKVSCQANFSWLETGWPITPFELGELIFKWSRLYLRGIHLEEYDMNQLRTVSMFNIAQHYEGTWDDEVEEEFQDLVAFINSGEALWNRLTLLAAMPAEERKQAAKPTEEETELYAQLQEARKVYDPGGEAWSVQDRADVSRLLFLMNRYYMMDPNQGQWSVGEAFMTERMYNHPVIMGVESQHFVSLDKMATSDKFSLFRRKGNCESLHVRLTNVLVERDETGPIIGVDELQYASAVVMYMQRLTDPEAWIVKCRLAVNAWEETRQGVPGKIRDICNGVTHTYRGGPLMPNKWASAATLCEVGDVVERKGEITVDDIEFLMNTFAGVADTDEVFPRSVVDPLEGFKLFT